MIIHELAALGAATCWALGPLISSTPARELGAIGFNRARMVMVFFMLVAWVSISGQWQSLGFENIPLLILSGFIGIFIGDTALFLTLNRLGPRRLAVLFAMNAPMAAVLGWLFLDETLNPPSLLGMVLVITGVLLAIIYGNSGRQQHVWEKISGPMWLGVGLGLTAALSQAVGNLITRPVMQTGADPVAASAIRIGIGALALNLLMQLPYAQVRQLNPLTPRLGTITALSGFIGMGLGMTLLVFALSGGKVGIVSTLSATSPILVLPLIWLRTREVPAPGAWLGALLVVCGTSLIFIN